MMKEINEPCEGSCVVSWCFSPGNEHIMLVGKQKNGGIEVINGFTGKEADELFLKLTTVKEEK